MRTAAATALGRLGRLVAAPALAWTGTLHVVVASLASMRGQHRAAHASMLRQLALHTERLGVRSLGPAIVLGAAVGLLGAVQLHSLLGAFLTGNDIWLILVLLLVREAAPLLAVVILAARSVSVMTSDLAQMQVADELDALQTMGVNPLHHAVLPRLLALLLSTVVLTAAVAVAALAGAGLVAWARMSIDATSFVELVQDALAARDVLAVVAKALGCGAIAAGVAAWLGLGVQRSREEIPHAVSRATLYSFAACVAFDGLFILVESFRLADAYQLFH